MEFRRWGLDGCILAADILAKHTNIRRYTRLTQSCILAADILAKHTPCPF
ncbi:hypothetical protein Q9L42_012185 [Methylomarinum sp. Ch1-1]|uniref:Transposase n=1 Tax=Methylomarinum roseum TaxID=3067653 RepID=A0AAU7NQ71_9GAMM|nr:hypothetical protein [Methylomarinum sp. Ch1-1]MDP4520936.1 hypothetical protein [Methylomarinum sp. Ch1-1]